jgi:hypothetical protein
VQSADFRANGRQRPADDAAKAAAICASGRIYAIKGDRRRLRRIAAALAAYPDVEVVAAGPVALVACPAGRAGDLLPVGARI